MTNCGFTTLNGAGLNLQAVLNLDQLPAPMLAQLRRHFDAAQRYRQLILIGHGGKTLWESVKASGIHSENPIDEFTVRTVEQWFAQHFAGRAREIIYPGNIPIGLQALGMIAGWHHASPFMIGISEKWGTWYAYRAVVLADTDLAPTRPLQSEAPCSRCADRICIASCPGTALEGGRFAPDKCAGYRREASSRCAATCIARLSCPLGSVHRYCDEQIHHSYSRSLNCIAPGAGDAPLTTR